MSVTIGVPDCSTGNRDFLAAQTLQTILVEIVAAERARTPASKFGHPEVWSEPWRPPIHCGERHAYTGNCWSWDLRFPSERFRDW